MDNNFYQDDEFEQFLQEEVKQHRMYPSDHIWKNIRTELHGYRTWPALTFISLFIITALTISTLLNNHPDKPLSALVGILESQNKTTGTGNEANAETASPANDYFQKIAPAQLTAETFASMKEEAVMDVLVTRNTGIDDAAVPVKTTIVADRSNPNYTARFINKTPAYTAAPANLQNTLLATGTTAT
jgi:hypothetical protein